MSLSVGQALGQVMTLEGGHERAQVLPAHFTDGQTEAWETPQRDESRARVDLVFAAFQPGAFLLGGRAPSSWKISRPSAKQGAGPSSRRFSPQPQEGGTRVHFTRLEARTRVQHSCG